MPTNSKAETILKKAEKKSKYAVLVKKYIIERDSYLRQRKVVEPNMNFGEMIETKKEENNENFEKIEKVENENNVVSQLKKWIGIK